MTPPQAAETGSEAAHSLVHRLTTLEPGEARRVLGSFGYFLFVLASYYTLRPIRDAMAVGAGVENMQYLFLSTFVCMLAIVPLYGWIVSKVPRRRLLPWVYAFFIVNILLFRAWFAADAAQADPWLARVFFVWVSVFNLFVVSVFWSFMADIWRPEQARRLFGLIAAGGSAGAVLGPLSTRALVDVVGLPDLLLVSAVLLAMGLLCLSWLIVHSGATPFRGKEGAAVAMGGDILAGAKLMLQHRFLALVSGFMFLGTMTGAMLYLQQAKVVSLHFDDPGQITGVFASVDLAVNVLTIVIQVALTGRIVRWLGLPVTLALLPVIATLGFGAITFVPAIAVIVGVQVLRRAVLFAITNPASNMIYTVVGPQSKYKFKHFVDTVVYRAGDTSGAMVFAGILKVGAGLATAAFSGMILAAAWTWLSVRLGRAFRQQHASDQPLP